jgi:ferredoxin-thioredoxin reductase catalytic subunit
MSKIKIFNDVDIFASMVAEKQGWVLNPDREFIDMIIDGLMVNYNRYGYFSCPCRDARGVREKDKDLICPCEYSKPDIAEFGHCYCGLYLSKEFYSSGKSPSSLPERRPLKN